ncbi:helix-turn-helix domain-containing protein [Paraflavitalea speifideaquila]|uniref:helix-turn-helix domain-containing protein n=1 Tax=Paraflavitalea speifideaquila TaxID=3076558 RepID=UPI0033130432
MQASPQSVFPHYPFQEALQQYGSTFKSLTDIAYECGYYDQSHFIHDFKEFSGYHPGQYFKGRPEGIEYKEV